MANSTVPFSTTLGERQRAGTPVAIADIAYPNGADPLVIEMLLESDCPVRPAELAAYGAWNTAGNTLGTTVAQAILSMFAGDDPERIAAQQRFLTHRFLEDWGIKRWCGTRRGMRSKRARAVVTRFPTMCRSNRSRVRRSNSVWKMRWLGCN